MTNQASQPNRRELLKWFASIPFLPLGAMATSASLVGCGDDKDNMVVPPNNKIKLKTASFTAMEAPTLKTPDLMAKTSVSSKLNVTWTDNSQTEYQLAHKTFFKTGEMVERLEGGEILAGGYFDINNQPIMDKSVSGKERHFFSDCPDGTSLFTVPDAKVAGVKGNTVFGVVQFEYVTRAQDEKTDMYGMLPSPIAVLTLDQNPQTGHLDLVKYHNVDTSAVHGLWITCGASLSPWGTHLSSEEYEPDAFFQGVGTEQKLLEGFSQHLYGNKNTANPYNYGHMPEVVVNKDGTAKILKHYCLGRISHELIHVMPDQRTALMGDDYTNGGLFMFVADKEKDLSAGTLYAAKYLDELNESSRARIQWIKLGHASSKEIDDMVNVQKIKATDIMESLTENPNDVSYTEIVLNKITLWVKVKPGMDKAAAFLETHRYAAMKGASMAFTKMEGTCINEKDKVAYSALANIQDSMIKDHAAWRKGYNVSFQKTIKAGGIVAHDMKGGMGDEKGTTIRSEWVPHQSYMLMMGEDIQADQDPLGIGNTAHPDKIASPDNLKFSEALRTLFIGEDSGNHVNNYLWAYNVDTKKLDRILSTPAGAESTGLHAVDSIHGWTYIMSNFQHPGDWNKLHEKVEGKLDPLIRANFNQRFAAEVGYITADPIAPSLEKPAETQPKKS